MRNGRGVALWLCGYVAIWPYCSVARVITWLCVYLAKRLCGYVSMWLCVNVCGHVATQLGLHGYVAIYVALCLSGYMALWLCGRCGDVAMLLCDYMAIANFVQMADAY